MSRSEDSDESRSGSSRSGGAGHHSAMRKLDTAQLTTKKVQEWSISDVAAFLQATGFSSIAPTFVEEMVSGEEFIELEDSDLRELGVRKLGERKRLRKKIKALVTKGTAHALDATSSGADGSSTSQSIDTIEFVAKYKKKQAKVTANTDITLDELLDKLADEFGVRVRINGRDEDGDLYKIKSDKTLYEAMEGEARVDLVCVKVTGGGGAKKRSGGASSKTSKAAVGKKSVLKAAGAQYVAFDALMDGFAVIDEEGTLLFFNKKAEQLFGYERDDVLGHNVKMLMPDTYAKKHDGYLAKYHSTGKKHVIDKERMVMAKRKDGSMFAITLAVTENKSDEGNRFVASIKPADADAAGGGGGAQYSALDALLEAAVVINEEGEVLHFNPAAEKLFGHAKGDVCGERVEMLMPSPHKESHHFYLQRYLSTGERRVVGKSREVLAELADGSLQMVTLALSEQASADGSKVFTGVLTKVAQAKKKDAGGAGGAGAKRRGDSAVQLARKMISSLQIPGIVVNEAGIVQAFNPAAEQMLGYQLVDVVGRNVSMLMNDKDAAKHDEYLKAYKTTGEAKVIGKERTVQAKTKAGKHIDVKLSITESEDDKGKKVWTGLLHQVSQLDAAKAVPAVKAGAAGAAAKK